MDTRTLVALGALVIAIIGGSVGAYEKFAKQEDLEVLAMDFYEERYFNQLDRTEERMKTIERKYQRKTGPAPRHEWDPYDRDEYERLEMEKRRLQRGK
jgi:hypothetical protein